MHNTFKHVAARVPGLLPVAYATLTMYRYGIRDPIVTRQYRRRDRAAPEIAAYVERMDRDGFVRLDGLFAAPEVAAMSRERDLLAARVTAGDIPLDDVTLGTSGTYRVNWKPTYGETVERVFFGNRSFEAVARRYLGGSVRKVYAIFQRSLPFESTSFGTSGFHFDYDRRTFKVFLYLSDVQPENGPFMYCPGTARLTSDKIRKTVRMHLIGSTDALFYSEEEEHRMNFAQRAIAITGPVGTVFFADTRGYHKASAITRGHRDVFVVYYGRD